LSSRVASLITFVIALVTEKICSVAVACGACLVLAFITIMTLNYLTDPGKFHSMSHRPIGCYVIFVMCFPMACTYRMFTVAIPHKKTQVTFIFVISCSFC